MIGPHFRDPEHRYVSCDGCTLWGVRLDPIEVEVYTGDPDNYETQNVGTLLTEDEGVEYVGTIGWYRGASLDGNVRRFRDLCPRCRLVVVA